MCVGSLGFHCLGLVIKIYVFSAVVLWQPAHVPFFSRVGTRTQSRREAHRDTVLRDVANLIRLKPRRSKSNRMGVEDQMKARVFL